MFLDGAFSELLLRSVARRQPGRHGADDLYNALSTKVE